METHAPPQDVVEKCQAGPYEVVEFSKNWFHVRKRTAEAKPYIRSAIGDKNRAVTLCAKFNGEPS